MGLISLPFQASHSHRCLLILAVVMRAPLGVEAGQNYAEIRVPKLMSQQIDLYNELH